MLLVLLEGVSIRYRILHDGRRQVVNITLPGDFTGFPGCFFENALYSISALTDRVLPAIPFAQLLGFFETYFRLAAVIFRTSSSEAAMYAEHLIGIGRRQLEENQAASREHTAALRRNWAVRRDSSFAEISPLSLPKGWIGFHASGPSKRRPETLDHVDRSRRASDLCRVNLARCPFVFVSPQPIIQWKMEPDSPIDALILAG